MDKSELLAMGFQELPHWTVTESVVFDLGRSRLISVADIGRGNEMVFLCEKSKVDGNYTDLICIHNRDYDGPLTKKAITELIGWFKQNNGSKRNG